MINYDRQELLATKMWINRVIHQNTCKGGCYWCDDSIEQPKITIGYLELATIFPQAKSCIKEHIKKNKKELGVILNSKIEMTNNIYGKGSLKERENAFMISDMWHDLQIEERNRKIKHYNSLLKSMEFKSVKARDGVISIGTPQVSAAKRVPISQFIEFDRAGFASCIWHTEDTPSMKYYPENNKVHCFACDKSGDVIDVIQQQLNLSFIEAVKRLI